VDPHAEKRMWALTHGNVLFLRDLVDQELRHNRLTMRNGRWSWEGAPTVSARLTDLIESQVGSVSDSVLDVVDLVAVSEPLDTAVLAGLVSAGAMEEAEQRGPGESVRSLAVETAVRARVTRPERSLDGRLDVERLICPADELRLCALQFRQ
jgi:hypothetical protein